MSFPKYERYKDSGQEWLGVVPEHWSVKRLRHFAEVLRGKFTHRPRNDPDFYDGKYPFVQTGDITGTSRYITEFKQTLNDRGIAVSKMFPRGTLVMAIAANIGDVAILDFPAYFPDSVVGLIPKDRIELMFLYYLMIGMKQPILMNASISTQMNLNVDQICSLSAACPPLDEQTAIVGLLDRETAKIDALMSEQRRLIELLKEKRQAVISHAVTKGLNPKTSMKPSGIEWLGDVPEHWSVVAIKRVLEVKDGTHATPEYVDPAQDAFPLVTSKDFNEAEICFDDVKYIAASDHLEVVRRSNTVRGDVLMSMIGGNIGKALIVETEREFSIKNVALFKTSQSACLAKYLLFYLQSGLLEIQIDLHSRGGAQGFLGLGDIRNLFFFKIPPSELRELVNELDLQLAPFSELIKTAEECLLLMKERRIALISAAVTGKIDVRGLAESEAA
jgi:type I restriction enzyme, S subunit